MKIKVLDAKTKQALPYTKVLLQVRGKDSGYLSYSTDANGNFDLDEKYKGQQICYYLGGNTSSQWITATDGATLSVSSATTIASGKEQSTTQSYK